MKIGRKLFLTTALAALLGLGAFAGAASYKEASKVEAGWTGHTIYYANATSYDSLYARVNRGGDTGGDQWTSHTMSKTTYKYGTKYVYTGEVWEFWGGLDAMYMKNGNAGADTGTPVQTIFESNVQAPVFDGKLYDGSNWKTVYKVDFDENGHGTAPSGQYVDSGGKISQPTAPTAEGYEFGGWYKEAGCTNAWNFNSDTVTANKTLYAKWTLIPTFTVSKYKILDGTVAGLIDSEDVVSGTYYDVPESLYEPGYVFNGWYKTSQCTSKYTGSLISANTPIYASYTSHAAWTGTISVDLKDTWYDAAANYAVYFIDKTTYSTEVGGWSTYVMGTAANVRLVSIPYSLPFEPKEMTLVRYNSAYTQQQWNSKQWAEGNDKWGQTPDLSFGEVIRVGTTVQDKKNLAYVGYPKVVRWEPSVVGDFYLDSVKLNGSNHAEYYSTSVSLVTNQQFKIQIAPYASGDYSGAFSTHDSLETCFSGDGTNNITCLVGGTYAFYFDSTANSTYITKVEIAEADEWAQYFLGHTGCDATGAALPTGWSDCATRYGALSGAAKNIIYSAKADEKGSYVEQAMARYDHAVKAHPSLTKFVVNSSDVVRASAYTGPVMNELANNGTTTTIIIAISTVCLAAFGGYFLFKKKHQ